MSFPVVATTKNRSKKSAQKQRKYLSSDLNIRLMYNMYVQKCQEEGLDPVKEPIYRRTFNTDFDLSFLVMAKGQKAR